MKFKRMQSSHFENFQPTEPYLTSFQAIEQERKDFQEMDPYFKQHPFTFSFLDQSQDDLKELRKLRRHCNQPFQFRPRPRRDFVELDQFEYLRRMRQSDHQVMEKQAQKKYQLVKDYYQFPYQFHQGQDQLYQEELERKERERYYPERIILPIQDQASSYDARRKVEKPIVNALEKKKVI